MQFGSVGDKVEATFNPECKLNLLVLIFHFETHANLLQFAKKILLHDYTVILLYELLG